MANKGFKRKLTAILSADVEGYSRLMGDNEEATVHTITAYREVLSTLIQQHNGNVLDSPGDNLLAEFASVVDAVQCAVAVQKEINSRNYELPENRRMHFRIGINLGDVIQEEERIYGDGVNIASRLEGLAEPGGICISKTAFDHIETKLPYGYEFLGDQTVKNIAKPVGAYRVMMEPRVTAAGKPKGKKLSPTKRVPILVGTGAVLFLAIAVGGWYFYIRPAQPPEEAASVENMAFPLPDKPSLAVLPFVNVGKDSDLQYICDGLTENIIAIISKDPHVFVIARNSSFTYKGKPVMVKKVAEELGVQYVIEGSVQKFGDQLRVTLQIIDALTGYHILSERFDSRLKDLFKLQDEIVFQILKATMTTGVRFEKKSNRHIVGTNNLDAYLKHLEAWYYFKFISEDGLIKAKQLAEEAIDIDPQYASAIQGLSWTYQLLGRYYSSGESRKKNLENGLKFAKKAIEIDKSNYLAYVALGYYYTSQKKYDIAVENFKKAKELDPANPLAHGEMTECFTWSYKLEEAVYHGKEAIRLDPRSLANYIKTGRAYFHLRQYEDAIGMHKRVIELIMQKVPYPKRWPHLHLAMVYSELGRDEDARAHMKKVLEFYPKFNLEKRRRALFFKDPANSEREIKALRKAGAPEHPPSE